MTTTNHQNPAKPATQKRSIRLQKAFLDTGLKMLQNHSWEQLTIPQIAKESNSSVGGFYSRFENKDGYLVFLRNAVVEEHRNLMERTLPLTFLREARVEEIIDQFLDTFTEIFTGRSRGFLRESYALTHSIPDLWTPIRRLGRKMADQFAEHIGSRIGKDGSERARFAVQTALGLMINDLMNPYHRIRLGDEDFRQHLTDIMRYQLRNIDSDS